MSNELQKIQAKIKALEEQMELHMPIRKDEIFEILRANDGIMIDDRLLAGFAIYATSKDSKSSSFLKELYELGKGNLPKGKFSKEKNPSKRSSSKNNDKTNITNKVSGDTKEEAQSA